MLEQTTPPTSKGITEAIRLDIPPVYGDCEIHSRAEVTFILGIILGVSLWVRLEMELCNNVSP